MDPLAALTDRWRVEAEVLRRCGHDRTAQLLERHADELDAALQAHENQLLSVAQAAVESGCCRETLRRRVRAGTLPAVRNEGARSQIKLRRADLPKKRPGRAVDRRCTPDYDPEEDARDIAQLLEQTT